MNTKDVITNVVAGVVSTGIVGGDATAISAALAGPVIAEIAVDFFTQALCAFQNSRLNYAFQIIRNKFQIKIKHGAQIRIDDSLPEVDRRKAQQMLEGVLLNIRDEYEVKKVEFHATQFVNICFEERIAFEQTMFVSRLLKQLTYRQLCILAYAYNTNINCGAWMIKFKDSSTLDNYSDFYSEILYLYNIGLLQQANRGISVGISGSLKLSALGKTIYDKAGLSSVSKEDVELIEYIIDKIAAV